MCLQVTAEWFLGDQVLLDFFSCSISGGPDLHPGAREEPTVVKGLRGPGLKMRCPAGLAPYSSAVTVSAPPREHQMVLGCMPPPPG